MIEDHSATWQAKGILVFTRGARGLSSHTWPLSYFVSNFVALSHFLGHFVALSHNVSHLCEMALVGIEGGWAGWTSTGATKGPPR